MISHLLPSRKPAHVPWFSLSRIASLDAKEVICTSTQLCWRRRAHSNCPGRHADPTHIGLAIEQDEIKGFSRTIAEIEWLLLILVLIYLVAGGPAGEGRAAIAMALCFFARFHPLAALRDVSTARNRC